MDKRDKLERKRYELSTVDGLLADAYDRHQKLAREIEELQGRRRILANEVERLATWLHF